MIRKQIINIIFLLFASTIAFGQIGALTPINGTGVWAGKVIGYKINTGKGVSTSGTDGLEAVITIYGNLQIKYKNKYQIYNGTAQVFNPTSPQSTPLTTHGIAFYVGDTNVNGNNVLYGNTRRGGTLVDHYQSDYNSYNDPSMTFSNTTVPPVVTAGTDAVTGEQFMSTAFTFNIESKIYLYTIEYRYMFPESRIKVKYSVTIPAGSKPVRMAHALDTYLTGSDEGPGYYSSVGGVDAVMVRRNGIFEAFVYNSGKKWSGYHSAHYSIMNDEVQGGAGSYMQFPNIIDANDTTDNGIGISIDFGNTAGNYSSTNYIAFQCNAPAAAPVDTSFTPSLATTSYDIGCNPTATFTYNATIPTGIELHFKEQSTGAIYIADATKKVYLPVGEYSYYFYDPVNSCVSPSGNNTVSITKTCPPCYKNPTTLSGGLNPIAAVSTITNRNATANWQNSYKGADMVVESKAGGFVLNRLTQVQIAAIPAANLVEGMIVYNITTNKMNIYVVDGANTGWKAFEVQSCQ